MSELTVGVRELKARLSEYLRHVKSGQTVVITDRGVPVGRIIPSGQSVEEKMLALADSGFLSWSGGKMEPIETIAVNRGDRLISDLIVEDRDFDPLP